MKFCVDLRVAHEKPAITCIRYLRVASSCKNDCIDLEFMDYASWYWAGHVPSQMLSSTLKDFLKSTHSIEWLRCRLDDSSTTMKVICDCLIILEHRLDE